jgi:cytochrome P450
LEISFQFTSWNKLDYLLCGWMGVQLTMILYETLRLFPPFPTQVKQATMDTMVGDLHLPKGACTFFPRLAIHHDPELWGIDVNEFKPERFVDGIANASKHQSAFQPFSFGKKSCLGQGFALQQAKVVLVAMLRQFRFHLSPNYRHAPNIKLTLIPKYGVPLILECLD